MTPPSERVESKVAAPVTLRVLLRVAAPSAMKAPEVVRRFCAWTVAPERRVVASIVVPEWVALRVKRVPFRERPWPA